MRAPSVISRAASRDDVAQHSGAVERLACGPDRRYMGGMASDLGDGRRALRGDAFTGVTRASRDLGIAERWLRDAIARGEVPTYRLGAGRG
jgi:hypothetical protein